jgi:hypothetical protein
MFGRPRIVNKIDAPADRFAGDCVSISAPFMTGVYVKNDCDYPVRIMYCNLGESRGCPFNNFVNSDKIFFPGSNKKITYVWGVSRVHLDVLACRDPYRPRVRSSMDSATRTLTHTFYCNDPKLR